MAERRFRVWKGELTGQYWAGMAGLDDASGVWRMTGKRYDVTADIERIIADAQIVPAGPEVATRANRIEGAAGLTSPVDAARESYWALTGFERDGWARTVRKQMTAALDELDRLRAERHEASEVIGLAIALHPDRCTPPDGRRMAAWCTWCDVLEPFREPQ